MSKISRLAAVALAATFLASTALAQTAAPAAKTDTKTTATTKTEKPAPKPRSAESLDCSKQADEKGLHGKERKKFRSECIKSAKAGTAGEKSK